MHAYIHTYTGILYQDVSIIMHTYTCDMHAYIHNIHTNTGQDILTENTL